MNKIYLYITIFIITYILIRKLNQIENYVNSPDKINNIEYDFIETNNPIPKKNNQNSLDVMKKYNVIFGGTVRNAAEFLKTNLGYIDECGKKFNSYKVIIYENDSNDDTRNILLNNKKENYEYIFEDGITEPLRTVRISNGRNKVLEKLREINTNNYYDYLIMIDLDDRIYSGKFVETINTCFEYDNWDVLTGNQSDVYYDVYALRKKGDMEYDCMRVLHTNPQIPNAYHIFVGSKYKKYEPGQLLEVDSAFGAIGIYKLLSIPDNCNYSGTYEDGWEICEHVPFHRCIKKNNKSIYINTSFLTN